MLISTLINSIPRTITNEVLRPCGNCLLKLIKMSQEMRDIWKRADCVCFDVDSTVITEEGIDELAKFCGKGNEVTELTNKAMGGTMTFEESLSLRLNIINPTREQIEKFVKTKPPTLTPGIKNLIKALQQKNVSVYLVSGGFKSIIAPIAKQLDIPYENIYANCIEFDDNGKYKKFDESQPTSRSGGKPKVMEILKSRFGYKTLVMIGDGATDLEACPPADGFIGFGGNVIREKVKKNAKWFVTNFNELIESL